MSALCLGFGDGRELGVYCSGSEFELLLGFNYGGSNPKTLLVWRVLWGLGFWTEDFGLRV